MKCSQDHNALATPFCPQCGQPRADTALSGLRQYVALQAKKAADALQDAKRRRDQSDAEGVARWLRSKEGIFAKWNGWLSALDEVANQAAQYAPRGYHIRAGDARDIGPIYNSAELADDPAAKDWFDSVVSEAPRSRHYRLFRAGELVEIMERVT